MNEPPTFAALARSVWRDFLRARHALFIYEVLFKLLEAWLLVPAAAVVLAAVLSRAGHIAVSNLDIVDFLLTPAGLLYAALFATSAVAFLLLEQAGVILLTDLAGSVERPPLKLMVRTTFMIAARVVQLSAVKVVLLALIFAPFVLLAA